MSVAILGIEILIDYLLGRLLARAGTYRLAEQARFLGDHNDVIVFEHQLHHRMIERCERTGEIDHHLIARHQRIIELACRLTIDHHMLMGKQRLDFGARFWRQNLE